MKRLQNRISGSRFALPVTAVYSLAAWLGMCAICGRTYAELAVFAMSAYLMAELNNRNALIRMYSRMVSCSFLVLGTMAAPAIGRLDVFAVQLCFIAAYLLLFASYQDKRAQGRMFYAFMFIGAASAVCPPSLLFVPVLWVLAATNLMAMSWRNFWASAIGLITPYWFIAGYCAITGDMTIPLRLADSFTQAMDTARHMPEPGALVSFAVTLLAAVTGAVHFMRNSYKDKIRTRMLYELLIATASFTAIFYAALPQFAEYMTAILIVNASVLAGHFFALTNTRLTNIAFMLFTMLAVAATAFNIMSHIPTANNLSPWSLL